MALANIKREMAARMIAEDREPDHRIAATVGFPCARSNTGRSGQM
jgi:hypothetical protein